MIDGLPAGPVGARVVGSDAGRLALVGRGVAEHAGRTASLLYVDGMVPARLQVRLLGPSEAGDNQVRAAAVGPPRAVERRRRCSRAAR